MKKQLVQLSLACAGVFGAGRAHAASITLSGTISQNTQDVGVPALANPSLNSIVDGDPFTVMLNFASSLASSANFATTSLLFSDASAGASESGFLSGQVTVSPSGGFAEFSVLGCLASCLTGNQLALEFQIPAGSLTSALANVQPIPALLPMDLLEDDGSTDIQGALSTYSYSGLAVSTPEPSTVGLVAVGSACLFLTRRNQVQERKTHVR